MGSSWGRRIGPALYCRVQLLLLAASSSPSPSPSNTASPASNVRRSTADTFQYDDDRDVVIHPRHRLFQRIHLLLAHLLGPCEEVLVTASDGVLEEVRSVGRQLQRLRRNERLFGRKQRSLQLRHPQKDAVRAPLVKQKSSQVEEQLALQHALQQQEEARLVSYLQHLHLLHDDLHLLASSLLLLQQYYTSFVHSFVHSCGHSLFARTANTPPTHPHTHHTHHTHRTQAQKHEHPSSQHRAPLPAPPHSAHFTSRTQTTSHHQAAANHHPEKSSSGSALSAERYDDGDQLRIAQYRLALYNEVRRCKHQPHAYTPTFSPARRLDPPAHDAEMHGPVFDEDAYDHDNEDVEGCDEEVAIDGGIVLQFWQRLQERRMQRGDLLDRNKVGSGHVDDALATLFHAGLYCALQDVRFVFEDVLYQRLGTASSPSNVRIRSPSTSGVEHVDDTDKVGGVEQMSLSEVLASHALLHSCAVLLTRLTTSHTASDISLGTLVKVPASPAVSLLPAVPNAPTAEQTAAAFDYYLATSVPSPLRQPPSSSPLSSYAQPDLPPPSSTSSSFLGPQPALTLQHLLAHPLALEQLTSQSFGAFFVTTLLCALGDVPVQSLLVDMDEGGGVDISSDNDPLGHVRNSTNESSTNHVKNDGLTDHRENHRTWATKDCILEHLIYPPSSATSSSASSSPSVDKGRGDEDVLHKQRVPFRLRGFALDANFARQLLYDGNTQGDATKDAAISPTNSSAKRTQKQVRGRR